MDRLTIAFAVMVAFFTATSQVAAHHGAATFDTGKKVVMEATVTEWIWANPHCFLKFAAKDQTGNVRNWVAETSNPPDMVNRGWARNSFKAGDELLVSFVPAKGDRTFGTCPQFVFVATGKRLGGNGRRLRRRDQEHGERAIAQRPRRRQR